MLVNDSIEESARKRKELRNQNDKFIAEQNSEIKKEIENRGISKLVHFTHPDNIEMGSYARSLFVYYSVQ